MLSWLDSSLAATGDAFMRSWTVVERAYRRPMSAFAYRIKFAFYPLLAIAAIGWLAWDWTHGRTLNSAENAVFDTVVNWRPVQPSPSGRVVVVEIDECSIEYFRARGEGGWPWSRQRHADSARSARPRRRPGGRLRRAVRRPSSIDPGGDQSLETIAAGAQGRFLFAATRMHPDYDASAPLKASQAPGAFPLPGETRADPPVALLLPYGRAMQASSALINVTRNEDGIMRDIPLYEVAGGFGIPSLPLRLATSVTGKAPSAFAATVRPNWRKGSRLPRASAADLLVEGAPVCGSAALGQPLEGRIALVGYTASGVNDAKPTPVDSSCPGSRCLRRRRRRSSAAA
jgi:hypothetical protein